MAHRTGPRVEAIAAPAKCGVGGAFGGQCSVDEGQRDELAVALEEHAVPNHDRHPWEEIDAGFPHRGACAQIDG